MQSTQRAPAAAPGPQLIVQDEGAGEDGDDHSATKNVFAQYQSSIKRGMPHPGDVAEASSLSAIALPKTDYPLWDALPKELVDSGKLSQLQLEGVLYACSKHCEIMPSGQRAGFFIGDGAGVGKGRQISGVIIDNFARGRRKHVWLSTSTDLHLDAERDLRDLGCQVLVINNCQTLSKETKALGLSKEFQQGVLFMTYSTLISSIHKKTRMQQVIDWLGGPTFDGCLVLDETHKAKNYTGNEKSSTKVAAAVIEIQALLPMARVLYCSATGVSEVSNMAYLSRMGLWGPATAFSGFDVFVTAMKRRGMSFLEMLAMEMKAEGKYVARGLSFRDAEFTQLEAELTEEQVALYDACAELWQRLRSQLELALSYTGATSKEVWKVFWGNQQRFFKLLCISLKVPTVLATAKAALEEGQCVVIGLQTTGEAAADAQNLEPGPVSGWVSPTRETLVRMVHQYFPTEREVPTATAMDAEGAAVGTLDAASWAGIAARVAQPVPIATPVMEPVPECVEAKAELLAAIDALPLPPNFLDVLLHELGGVSQVAEMTGRKGRIVKDARGRMAYELRAKPETNDMDSLNVREKDAFMKGSKLVAIISDAASTGISLHASLAVSNQRRRLHMTIELPWSADKAIQQLGRSHRSNQSSGPLYKLVTTRIGGEKRFAAAVARRLQSMGALTRGDRRAASGVDLSDQNFDSTLGRKALRRMYEHIASESGSLPQGVSVSEIYKGHPHAEDAEAALKEIKDAQQVAAFIAEMHANFAASIAKMGVIIAAPKGGAPGAGVAVESGDGEEGKGSEAGDVRKFLNRLLGLEVVEQNVLFNYFVATLAAEIHSCKLAGRYSEGLSDLRGSKITAGRQEVLWVDPGSQLQTLQNVFAVDRGVTYEEAVGRLERERVPGDDSGFRRSKRPLLTGRHTLLLALLKPGSKNTFTITKPNTGDSPFDMERDELEGKYRLQEADETKEEWTEVYDMSVKTCFHGPDCKMGTACTVGKRITEVTVLSGSVVRVWGQLEQVLSRHEHSLSRAERSMRVVRVALDNESHLVGVRYPAHLLTEVILTLQSVAAAPTVGQPVIVMEDGVVKLQAPALAAKVQPTVKEPPTPIDCKALAFAFRAPKTIKDFFSTKAAKDGPPSSLSTNGHQDGKPASATPGAATGVGGAAAGAAHTPPGAAEKRKVSVVANTASIKSAAKRLKPTDVGGTQAHAFIPRPAINGHSAPVVNGSVEQQASSLVAACATAAAPLAGAAPAATVKLSRLTTAAPTMDEGVVCIDVDEDDDAKPVVKHATARTGAVATDSVQLAVLPAQGGTLTDPAQAPPIRETGSTASDQKLPEGDGSHATHAVVASVDVSAKTGCQRSPSRRTSRRGRQAHYDEDFEGNDDGVVSEEDDDVDAEDELLPGAEKWGSSCRGKKGGGKQEAIGGQRSSVAGGKLADFTQKPDSVFGNACEVGVDKLIGMGFSKAQAQKSLWMAKGNVDRAVELCLSKMCG